MRWPSLLIVLRVRCLISTVLAVILNTPTPHPNVLPKTCLWFLRLSDDSTLVSVLLWSLSQRYRSIYLCCCYCVSCFLLNWIRVTAVSRLLALHTPFRCSCFRLLFSPQLSMSMIGGGWVYCSRKMESTRVLCEPGGCKIEDLRAGETTVLMIPVRYCC